MARFRELRSGTRGAPRSSTFQTLSRAGGETAGAGVPRRGVGGLDPPTWGGVGGRGAKIVGPLGAGCCAPCRALWIHFHLERGAPAALISPPRPRLCRRGRPGLPSLPSAPARLPPAPLSGPAARSEPAGRVIGGRRRRSGRPGLR
jgi:hypothetical protein